jgi:PadR family transcriptional regulator, regulatory protein AphA
MDLNKTSLAILGILSRGPQTGYDVKKVFTTITSHFWRASYGQIYPLLKKLKDQGLVKHKTKKFSKRLDKHIYSLTAEGEKSLRKWLRSPVETQPWRIEILLRLFCGRQVPVAENIRQVEIYQRHKQEELVQLQEIERELQEEHAADPDQPYYLLTVDYGQKVVRACLEWCEESLANLETMQEQGFDQKKDDKCCFFSRGRAAKKRNK